MGQLEKGLGRENEFPQPLHEFRVLIDWAQAFRIRYRGLASAGDYNQQVAIEITA